MKPILFLDIDGVLNPEQPDKSEFTDFAVLETDWSNFFLSKKQAGYLTALSEYFDLTWATSWGQYANDNVAEFLGFPHLPVVHFEPENDATLKIQDIIRYATKKGTPFVWVDDEMESSFTELIKDKFTQPFFLIQTNPVIGLTRKELAQIYKFYVMVS